MLKSVGKLITSIHNANRPLENLSVEERLARSPWPKACTPDALIVAKIVRSMAENFLDWTAEISGEPFPLKHEVENYNDKNPSHRYKETSTCNFKMSIVRINGTFTTKIIVEGMFQKLKFVIYNPTGDDKPRNCYSLCDAKVNGVSIHSEAGMEIYHSYIRLRNEYVAAEKTAAEELMKTETEQKKWDLVEKLLGMKRTELGALVPVEEYQY